MLANLQNFVGQSGRGDVLNLPIAVLLVNYEIVSVTCDRQNGS